EILSKKDEVESWVKQIISERKKMAALLDKFPFVLKIYPSDTNFLLVNMHDANGIYSYLIDKGIIVRDRSKVHLCENSLRITIGTSNENETLLNTLKELI
ncbi:MAG: aminotransferase class I/II-fold pyridoxal phosphate-dependent enzyme, partial [Draconibacterium sp.]|nr:aminotransferase class I/II-fold pyridoxal phosphate-dependent enzyme [Draconibacterium sp.]